jgi:hypothetical protein
MRKAWDHGDRPPPPFISERPPFRAAAVARRNPPHQRNQRTRLGGGAAVVGGSGLSSGRFTVAGTYFYLVLGGMIETTNQLVWGVFHINRISSGIVSFERKGGEAVELSYGVLILYMKKGVLAWIGYISWNNRQITQIRQLNDGGW